MNVLTLSLKRKWFDMIKSGIKLEEYREINDYWEKRLTEPMIFFSHLSKFKEFDKIVFTLGYPKADDTIRRIEFYNPRIDTREGRTEWGAEPGKTYFVITWER